MSIKKVRSKNLSIKLVLGLLLIFTVLTTSIYFIFKQGSSPTSTSSKNSIPTNSTSINTATNIPPTNNNVTNAIPTSSATTPTPSPTIKPTPSRSVYIGFWTQGFWNSNTQSVQPQTLINIQNEIGKKVAIANYYRGWDTLTSANTLSNIDTVENNGWVPMISAEPYFFSGCPSTGMSLYRTIASGSCDNFLKEVGNNLKQSSHKILLRFAWEMNVSTIKWSVQSTGDSPNDFIHAWQHFHDILKEVGATNVLWVFCPQIATPSTVSITSLYPGNNYVDWGGLDGYNWGTSHTWSKWQSFSDIFTSSYNELHNIAPSKPLMIGETGSVTQGGDRTTWYKDMLSQVIPNSFKNLSAIVFFNEDKTKTENANWLIDQNHSTLEQIKESLSNPLYKSSLIL